MTFAFVTPGAGWQPIPQTLSSTDTYPPGPHIVGDIVTAVDPVLGGGEFIYLKGVASTAVGDVVTYDTYNQTSTRWDGTANTGLPLAVAMSANVLGQWGWYQISGAATVNIGAAVAAGGKVFYGGTTATVDDAQVNGKQIQAASFLTTSASGTAIVQLQRPFVQGQTV